MRKLVAWAVGPVMALGGVAMCLMAAPGPASAGNTSTVTASVTVPESVSFSGPASITFTAPPSLPGPALNNPQHDSWFASTNDPKGGTVSVTASGDFTGTQAGNAIPISALSLNNTPFPESNPTLVDETIQPTFITEGADVYSLFVPNVAPDTYTTTLTYTAAGN